MILTCESSAGIEVGSSKSNAENRSGDKATREIRSERVYNVEL